MRKELDDGEICKLIRADPHYNSAGLRAKREVAEQDMFTLQPFDPSMIVFWFKACSSPFESNCFRSFIRCVALFVSWRLSRRP
jgi:hypothetical protein